MQNIEPSASPFHYGEQAVQERLGVRGIEDWARKVVRDHLPEQHRAFHTSLPFLVVSARDASGRPWATILEGADGFVTSPDPTRLVLDTRPAQGDALEGAFVAGADMGILGIEPATRRRNRVNGRVERQDTNGIIFVVDQSFGNCPQYIRERDWHRVEPVPPPTASRGTHLTERQQDGIKTADTFFIASGYRGDGESPTYGMDVSHRGGERGFVDVIDGSTIRFPDYAGNNHYNTIGNLVLDPRAGFLFIDFESGSLLQLSGRATLDWDSEELEKFPGAHRLITLEIDEVVDLPSALSLRWQVDADSVRSLRLIDKTRESADVTSFVFDARDSGPLVGFEPGQHLPIELAIPGRAEPVRRTYSLSSAPADNHYRISVKREPKGLASRFLHDHLEPGAIIDARHPAGDFMMTCNNCPLVLVSAGVGVTPMMSILRSVAAQKSDRPVWFVHGARDGDHHPFAQEVRDLVVDRPNITVHVSYSQPGPDDRLSEHVDVEGRLSGDLLGKLVPHGDAHYYICGPTRFMTQIQNDLESRSIPAEQIHTETFGPVAGG